MKDYNEIQDNIDKSLEGYIKKIFYPSDQPLRYYYWTVDYFKIVHGLSFRFFTLDEKYRPRIKKTGKKMFDDDNIAFEIDYSTHRFQISLINYNKLFNESNKSGQMAKSEYVTEFIFWKLLIKIQKQLVNELQEITVAKYNEEEYGQKKNDVENFSGLVDFQYKNFILTYLEYLCNEHEKPIHPWFTMDYINYLMTNKGEDLKEKIDLDEKHDNTALKDKISRLYVYRTEEKSTHFIFSRIGGGEKEELRELLEILGDEENGSLYRGQADTSWSLDSSLTREDKFINNEIEMYYEVLSLKPDAFRTDRTVYERLITMQHFGMPTRLMDITRNPLVAIFFACNNFECKNVDGAIFSFSSPEKNSDFLNFEDTRLEYLKYLFSNHIDEKDLPEYEKFINNIWFIRGLAKNQRISSQSGDFIFVGKGDGLKSKLRKLPKMTIIIDCFTKKVLLEQLETLNVHGGAVYPDLTHMSNYIRQRYSSLEPKKIKLKGKSTTISNSIGEAELKVRDKIMKFDFTKIKSRNRDEQIRLFADFYNLNVEGLGKIISDILFTERKPFRDEIAKVMQDKVSVLREQEKLDEISKQITTLAKMVGEER